MELARYHRLRSTFYRLEASRCSACRLIEFPLEASRCSACRLIEFPPRQRCRHCGSEEMEPAKLSGRGKILSHTRVYQPARGFRDASVTALIELEEGVRVIAQLTDVDPEDVATGQEVEMVVRRLRADEGQGMLVYGYKFRPVLRHAEATA
jgi:uncharacterized OB-fold protein